MRKPYSLQILWQDSRRTIEFAGHNPVEVAGKESTIARNGLLIARIELHDLTGVLETIWASNWQGAPTHAPA